jgi:hypothetical protein
VRQIADILIFNPAFNGSKYPAFGFYINKTVQLKTSIASDLLTHPENL